MPSDDHEIHTLTADLAESRAQTAALREAFVRHRTATHAVKPHVCLTCQESDAALALSAGPGTVQEG